MKNIFLQALHRQNQGRSPVWFMRQAGRYHKHYQAIRARHSFMEMCKNPVLASEITRGPLEDFGFDAAILFSDLLFPLEALGMGLTYEPGPKLAWHLRAKEDLRKLVPVTGARVRPAAFMEFQAEALRILSKQVAPDKGLIGFVGGPWTLFCYAVEGSHAGALSDSQRGLTDGRFEGFLETLIPLLSDNMILQAEAGAQAVALFDTCAGELDAATYGQHVVPALEAVLERFQKVAPQVPVIYYSKKTDPEHWRKLENLSLSCLGVDWRHDMATVLKDFGSHYAIQGNVDPQWLFLPAQELETKLREYFSKLTSCNLSGYVCGLGHGVLPQTPEDNVRLFLKLQREVFSS